MTATTSRDQQEVVDQLVVKANYWANQKMPPGCEHMDPLPERLDGFVSSLFVELEGAGGLPRMRLSPNHHPDVNLVDHNMHDTWPRVDQTTFVRAFLMVILYVLGEVKRLSVDRREAMGRLGVAVCRTIERGYELRAERYDEDCDGQLGPTDGLGDDVAPGLTEAFRTAWAAR